MRLKSLRLFGFKTFAEQTTITFEPGITGIVGPNGSGKSNVVDAIRWALGEHSAKSLRSTRTEDVIFAGNERRKPLGMAEVSVTFDNADRVLPIDALEVQITRRAYRTGESEYYINREHVRLRDVVDLLSGTGLGPGSYAIVSQGQIDAILTAKPSDRRGLFEEAAGIGRFLTRKAESLRRLEATEQNAIRISDLLSEFEKRLPELDTQVRRAERYRKTAAKLRDYEILSYLRASTSRRLERESLQAELETQRSRARSFDAGDRTARKRAIGHANPRVYRRTGTRQRARSGHDPAFAGGRVGDAARGGRRAPFRAGILRQRRRSRAGGKRAAEPRGHDRAHGDGDRPADGSLDAGRERERKAQEALATARLALDRIFGEFRGVEAAAAAAAAADARRRAEFEAAQHEYERLERETYRLREEAHGKAEEAASLKHEIEAAGADAAAAEVQLVDARAELERVTGSTQTLARTTAELQERLRGATTEFAGAQARLHTIEELEANLEGHVPGTRAIVEARTRGDSTGVVGVVADLIRVDEKYTRALDVAFGAGLSNIVVETAEDAENAIAYLKARESGRATFLPLDVLGDRTGRTDAPAQSGVIGYAHTLVESEPRFAGIVALPGGPRAGGRFAGSRRAAGARPPGGEPSATRSSPWTASRSLGGGAMTGGRYKRERSILSRRAQARSLREALPRLSAAIAEVERELEEASKHQADLTARREDARRAVAAHEMAVRDLRAKAERLGVECARLDGEVSALLDRSSEAEHGSGEARRRLVELESPPEQAALSDAERERLEEALAEARRTIGEAQEAERAIAAEIGTGREALASLIAQRDAAHARREMLDADTVRAEAARESMQRELAELSERISALETDLQQARERVTAADEALRTRREERDALAAGGVESERKLREAQERERSTAGRGDAARLRLAEIDAELGMLAAAFAQNPATADECADVSAATKTSKAMPPRTWSGCAKTSRGSPT